MNCCCLCVVHWSASGPLRTLASVRRSFGDRARRARRRPPVAHAGSVAAARRLRCAARPELARHNSLRELRSLRSDRCRESDLEARAARAPRPCLRCSPTQKSPPACAPWRDGKQRCLLSRTPPVAPQRTVRAAGRAQMQRRAPQGSWPRAQRASTADSPHLSERRERSELCGGPRDRGAQGSLRHRRRPRHLSAAGCPRGPLLAPDHERGSRCRTTDLGRKPTAIQPLHARESSRWQTHRPRDHFLHDLVGAAIDALHP